MPSADGGRPLRIVHLLPSLEMGGMERMVAGLAAASVMQGHEVTVLCTSTRGVLADELVSRGVRVDVARPYGLPPWFGRGAIAAALGADNAPDLVHSHSGVWWRSVAAAASLRVPGRVHTVHGLHAHEPWWGPFEKRAAASITDRVLAVSPSLSEYLVKSCRIPAAKVEVLPNGVDVARFAGADASAWRSRLPLGPTALLIGTVARLAPIKNIPLAIRAVATLASEGLDVHYAVAGDGQERESLAGLVRDLGAEDRVHLVGELADPAPFIRALDIFALPSHKEGTSLSLLEAMASGRCCVATAVGGTPDVLAHGDAGVLVPDNDLDALTSSLRRLATRSDLRASLGRAAALRAQTTYSAEAMARRYHEIYQAVVGAAS